MLNRDGARRGGKFLNTSHSEKVRGRKTSPTKTESRIRCEPEKRKLGQNERKKGKDYRMITKATRGQSSG